MLLQRQYSPKVIECALERVMKIDRNEALKRVVKSKTTDKLTFVTTFDPRLPSVSRIVRKHFDHMSSNDPYLGRVFSGGVQIAYKRNKNIRDILCRARLYPVNHTNNRPRRTNVGFKTCGKCTTCSFSENVKSFRCHATGEEISLTQDLKCTDKGVIYVICCRHCNQQYVGKTSGTFRARMDAHRTAIRGSSDTTVAAHFKLPGHKFHHFFAFPIELVTGDPFTIGARERYWINKLDVISRGINCNRTYV